MSELETLYRVQELDIRVHELLGRERNNPLKAELDGLIEVEGVRLGELEAAEAALKESRDKQGEMDKEVQRIEEKQRREEEKLYGGKVTNPKELRGLQAEVRSIKRQKDALETDLLEEMERQDEMNVKVKEARSGLEGIQAETKEKRGIIDSETAEIHKELETLEAKRGELRSGIGEELLELYDRLLENKHNLAVAKVVEGVCQGCRVELPAKDYDRFLKSDDVFRCTNCGRIMVKAGPEA